MAKDELKINVKWLFIAALALVAIGLMMAILFVNPGNKESTNPGKEQVAALKGTGSDFLGEKGEAVQVEGEKVYIKESQVSDGNLRAFNYYSENKKKTIYFFIIRASDNTYRVAANACEICFDSLKGFSQIGNQIRCENCQVMYSKDQIALQKGGCNPRPIDKDAEIIDGRLAINVADIEKTADLF